MRGTLTEPVGRIQNRKIVLKAITLQPSQNTAKLNSVHVWVCGCGLPTPYHVTKFIHDKTDPNSNVAYLINFEAD